MKQIVIYCADVEAYRQAGMTFPLYIIAPWFSVTLESEKAEAIVPYQEDSLRVLETSLPKGIGYRVQEVDGAHAKAQAGGDIEQKVMAAEAQYEAQGDEQDDEQAEPKPEEQTQSRRRRRGVSGE
ncbi:MAG: hypothetical protein QW815_07610 [Nitrososphaerota archaeon]